MNTNGIDGVFRRLGFCLPVDPLPRGHMAAILKAKNASTWLVVAPSWPREALCSRAFYFMHSMNPAMAQ